MSEEPARSPDRKRSLDGDSDSADQDARSKRQAMDDRGSRDTGRAEDASIPKAGDLNPAKMEEDNGAPRAAEGEAPEEVPAVIVSMRALVSNQEAGVIIGKGGKNVIDIRNGSGARVNISEHIQGAIERVITVTGTLDCVAKAFALVAQKVIEETMENERNGAPDPTEVKSRHYSLRLLIANVRMGSVIGKGGSQIKHIQEESVARVTASEDPLPGSTERVVTISGVTDSIHRATYFIGKVLQDNADRPGSLVPYRPVVTGRGGGPSGYIMPAYGYQPMPPSRGAPMAMQQVQQIFVPNEMMGSIIGKGGSKINEIRQRSGSQIRVADQTSGSAERLVTISGTPEANQMALYLLYSRIEMEKQRAGAA